MGNDSTREHSMTKETTGYTGIRPATIDDLPEVLNDLVPAELADSKRLGVDPVVASLLDLKTYKPSIAFSPDSKPMVLFGVDDSGYTWMLNTNEVFKHPRFFMKNLKVWFENQPHKMLHSFIDIQNIARIKMLKRVGFKLLRLLPVEMNGKNHYFVEIVRL